MKIINIIPRLLILISVIANFTFAQTGGGGEASPKLKTNTKSLKAWQDMRFGMFIHWGPVSLRGTEIGWSRGKEVPIAEYDNLYKEFNPVLFNAKEWVKAAKDAGMKYIVITSKHHDGFCLFDSKFTDHKITNSPFKRDVLKELSDECKKQGILFCTYYSILDWHHPDYTTRYGGDARPVESSDMKKYIKYLKGQLEELVKNYHTNLLWFDGQWEKSWTHEDGMDLYSYVRKLNDKILINNRVDKGNVYYRDKDSKYAGDFDTPEQKIGEFNPGIAWESCITIADQWAWKPNDKMKSLKECLQTLIRTAGGGGNLLFNVGPMPDGRIEKRQVERLKDMGNWLKKYGESIYGTTGGPVKPAVWGASTNKGNKIFVHLFSWPEEELRLARIPEKKILNVKILGGEKLKWKPEGEEIVVSLPAKPVDENCTVITIELDGPAKEIKPVDFPKNSFSELFTGSVKLKTLPNPKYPGDGAASIIDKERGSDSYMDKNWLGYEGENFEALIDLSNSRPVGKVTAGFLEDQNSWIFFPKTIEVLVSDDGVNFKPAGKVSPGEPKQIEDARSIDYEIKFESVNTRYVKLLAENVKVCPPWHKGAGGKAWLFIDEIIVK